MFSRSSPSSAATSARNNDDSHLEVTVTPSASAFYAGEVFSAVISFHNSRVPYHTTSVPSPNTPHAFSVPTTPDPNASGNWPHSGFFPPSSPLTAHTPDSSRSPGGASGWRGEHARRPSGHGHTRRTQSLALGKGTLSPQEMVWALGGGDSTPPPTISTPPPLPLRRGSSIPSSHPHARKISLASNYAPSPPPSAGLHSAPLSSALSEDDTQMQDAQAAPQTPDLSYDSRSSLEAGSSRRPSSRPSPSPSPTLPDVMEEPYWPSHSRKPEPQTPGLQLPPRPPLGRRHSPTNSTPMYSSTSSLGSLVSSDAPTENGSGNSSPRRPPHVRAPSYHNAYGASLLTPPVHPSMKNRLPLDTGSTTILWAHTRLVARFSPSHQHIPPDPLLPLKSKLLHQPIGSGSLAPADAAVTKGSRWSISFGTGAIGKDAQPSLTGSLFGLAKGLVYGGSGGSLEEERKRVWNTSDLPVLETTRSLIGVDIRLAEGETREFVYTLQLPTSLPPAFKGRALKFSYDLVVSLNVALPGPGKRQRTKEITIPVRVWPNVSLSHPLRSYDVLHPVIQTTEQASVNERPATGPTVSNSRRHNDPPRHKVDSLATYARRLLETLDEDNPIRVPPSPSKAMLPLAPMSPGPMSPYMAPLSAPTSPPTMSPRVLSSPERTTSTATSTASPTTPTVTSPIGSLVVSLNSPVNSTFPKTTLNAHAPLGAAPLSSFLIPDDTPRMRPRATSLVTGDEELVEEQQRCGEAVEILSRHSPKASFDIRKDGEVVAVLTLIKTTYRLGETVMGVVTFNEPRSDRRVLKLGAFLETHEVIPEPLLPPSASSSGRVRQPELRRVHAEHCAAYALHTERTAFSLDIPSDATPAFSLKAGNDGAAGGLEWRVRLAFLVAVPPKRKSMDARKSMHMSRGSGGGGGSGNSSSGSGDNRRSVDRRSSDYGRRRPAAVAHMLPTDGGDADNATYTSAPTLVPFMREGNADYVEARAETVECEVPVSVLAGNTAFVVRPSVYSV